MFDMSLTSISLPKNTPRDAVQIKKKIPLIKGILHYYILGIGSLIFPFLIGFTLASLEIFPKISWNFLIVFFTLFEISAFYFIYKANTCYLNRLKAFTNGVLITGKIIEINGKFDFLRFKKVKNITVQITYNHNIITKNTFPISYKIDNLTKDKFVRGLYDPETKTYFFPMEIGLDLEEK